MSIFPKGPHITYSEYKELKKEYEKAKEPIQILYSKEGTDMASKKISRSIDHEDEITYSYTISPRHNPWFSGFLDDHMKEWGLLRSDFPSNAFHNAAHVLDYIYKKAQLPYSKETIELFLNKCENIDELYDEIYTGEIKNFKRGNNDARDAILSEKISNVTKTESVPTLDEQLQNMLDEMRIRNPFTPYDCRSLNLRGLPLKPDENGYIPRVDYKFAKVTIDEDFDDTTSLFPEKSMNEQDYLLSPVIKIILSPLDSTLQTVSFYLQFNSPERNFHHDFLDTPYFRILREDEYLAVKNRDFDKIKDFTLKDIFRQENRVGDSDFILKPLSETEFRKNCSGKKLRI